MSMFTITGKVVNVFDQPGRIDKETGEMSPSTVRLQLLGEMPVQNGQSRLEMVTVKIEDKKTYMELTNKEIRLPLGLFAPSKGSIVYYVPKGSHPELVKHAA